MGERGDIIVITQPLDNMKGKICIVFHELHKQIMHLLFSVCVSSWTARINDLRHKKTKKNYKKRRIANVQHTPFSYFQAFQFIIF